MYYNFMKLHSKLRMSPLMAAGVSDKLLEIGVIVSHVQDEEDKTRSPYKKAKKCNIQNIATKN
jgi:hypothetical protein